MNKVRVHFWVDALCFREPCFLFCLFFFFGRHVNCCDGFNFFFLQFLIQASVFSFQSLKRCDIFTGLNTVGVLVVTVCFSLAYCLWFCVNKSWYTTWVNSVVLFLSTTAAGLEKFFFNSRMSIKCHHFYANLHPRLLLRVMIVLLLSAGSQTCQSLSSSLLQEWLVGEEPIVIRSYTAASHQGTIEMFWLHF